jgi:hypothetical protein
MFLEKFYLGDGIKIDVFLWGKFKLTKAKKG